jgi:hypothetical protein
VATSASQHPAGVLRRTNITPLAAAGYDARGIHARNAAGHRSRRPKRLDTAGATADTAA